MVWAVTPIRYGLLSPIPSVVLGWQPPDAEAFRLPSLGYLLDNLQTGQRSLVDLGPSSPAVSQANGRSVVVESEWVGVAGGLRRAGIDPESVGTVIVTHGHWDHSYGAEELPNAHVIVQSCDLDFGADAAGAQARYFDRTSGLLAPGTLLQAIDGDKQVDEGIRCVRLGGHTPGSQVVLVETVHGVVACLGDIAHRYENILGLSAGSQSHPSGLLADRVQWEAALQRLAGLSVIPVLAHDERSRLVLEHSARLVGRDGRYRIHGDDWELLPDPAAAAAFDDVSRS